MPKRQRPLRRTDKLPDVHLVYRSHAPGDEMALRFLREGVKSFIHEEADGSRTPHPDELFERMTKSSALHGRSMGKRLLEWRKKGISIIPGELLENADEEKRLQGLTVDLAQAFKSALTKPALEKIKRFYKLFLARENMRGALILRTIHDAQKPLVALYGAAHSSQWPQLKKELEKKRLDAQVSLKARLFPLGETVLRKLQTDRVPSDLEYKKGFISMVLMNGEKSATNKEGHAREAAQRILLNALTESQIDEILSTRQFEKIYALNGLPDKPTVPQLEEFLTRHSLWWKRQHQKNRKEKI